MDFKRFVLASALGRGGRFFLVGAVITIFGEPVKAFLDSYFELAVIAFAVLFIGSFVALNLLTRRRHAAEPAVPLAAADIATTQKVASKTAHHAAEPATPLAARVEPSVLEE